MKIYGRSIQTESNIHKDFEATMSLYILEMEKIPGWPEEHENWGREK